MSIELDIRHRLDRFTLEARFACDGGLVALFGRSGAGKTTLINLIGGLLRPQSGRIVVDGRVLADAERGVHIPLHRRRLGYVFQESRLFPHLSVRQNLLYGRWFTPRRERHGSLEQVVELLGIGHLLNRRPAGLSGGEKQRVAIGRALLASPRLLLMDEPLASLDAARKNEILPYIERLRDELRLPVVYVSHSVEEVARLAGTVVLLSDGQVVATGPVAEVMSRLDLRPAAGRFEAGSVLTARVKRHDPRFALSILTHPAGELKVPALDAAPGETLRLRVRARDVALALHRPQGISIRNVLAARIEEIDIDAGAIAELRLDAGGQPLLARITRETVHELDLRPGQTVFALIKSVAFDRRGVSAPPDSPALAAD